MVKKSFVSMCVGVVLASVSGTASADISFSFWSEPAPVVVTPYYPAPYPAYVPYAPYPEEYVVVPPQRRFPARPYPYPVPAPAYPYSDMYVPYTGYGPAPAYATPYPGGSDMYVPAY